MAYSINLQTFTDARGNLTVIEKIIPFDIRRIFYIYGVDSSKRGGHRHHKTIQAAICIKGKCTIYCNDSSQESVFELHAPHQCVVLEPRDWHTMYDFSHDAILMILASEYFDPKDYIFDPYQQ